VLLKLSFSIIPEVDPRAIFSFETKELAPHQADFINPNGTQLNPKREFQATIQGGF